MGDVVEMEHNADQHLQSLVQRYDRVKDEIDVANEALKDLKTEIKSLGYDEKAIAEIVKVQRMSEDQRKKRDAHEQMVHLYGEQLKLW